MFGTGFARRKTRVFFVCPKLDPFQALDPFVASVPLSVLIPFCDLTALTFNEHLLRRSFP
jgi:hypothetical protein